MKTINRIVITGTVLFGLAGLLGCGDSSKSQREHEKGIEISQTSTDSTVLENYAREHMNGPSHPAEFSYLRALYFNNLTIIENNEKILQQRGLSVDVSEPTRKAVEAQNYAQEHMNGPSHPAKFKYLEAVSITDKIIMQQQKTLMK